MILSFQVLDSQTVCQKQERCQAVKVFDFSHQQPTLLMTAPRQSNVWVTDRNQSKCTSLWA